MSGKDEPMEEQEPAKKFIVPRRPRTALIARRLCHGGCIRHAVRGRFNDPRQISIVFAGVSSMTLHSQDLSESIGEPHEFRDGIWALKAFPWHEVHGICTELGCHDPHGVAPVNQKDIAGKDLLAVLTRTYRLQLLCWLKERFVVVWEWSSKYRELLIASNTQNSSTTSSDDLDEVLMNSIPGFPFLVVHINLEWHLLCPSLSDKSWRHGALALPAKRIMGWHPKQGVAHAFHLDGDTWEIVLDSKWEQKGHEFDGAWKFESFEIDIRSTQEVHAAPLPKIEIRLRWYAPGYRFMIPAGSEEKHHTAWAVVVNGSYCISQKAERQNGLPNLVLEINKKMEAGQLTLEGSVFRLLAYDYIIQKSGQHTVCCSYQYEDGETMISIYESVLGELFLEKKQKICTLHCFQYSLPAFPEQDWPKHKGQGKLLLLEAQWLLSAPYRGDPFLISPQCDCMEALIQSVIDCKKAFQVIAGRLSSIAPAAAACPEQGRASESAAQMEQRLVIEALKVLYEQHLLFLESNMQQPEVGSSASKEILRSRMTDSRHHMILHECRLYIKYRSGTQISRMVIPRGSSEAIALSNTGPTASLRFIPTSLRLLTRLESEPVPLDPVTALWALKSRETDSHHSVILLSFANASRALKASGVMEDVSDRLKIIADEETIACGLIADNILVQVTPSAVQCCRLNLDSSGDNADESEIAEIDVKRAALTGVESELLHLKVQDDNSSTDKPSPSRQPFANADSQDSDVSWRPSESVRISAACCTTGLVAVCQDKLTRFLILEGLIGTPKRKRQDSSLQLQQIMDGKTSESVTQIKLVPQGQSKYLVLQYVRRSGMVVAQIQTGMPNQPASLVPPVHNLQDHVPKYIRHAEADGSSEPDALFVVSSSFNPKRNRRSVELLMAWRDGVITHFRLTLGKDGADLRDAFHMGDAVLALQLVSASKQLYLAMGSETFLLKYNKTSHRFLRQRIQIQNTRLAAPFISSLQPGRQELMMLCISESDEHMSIMSLQEPHSLTSQIDARPLRPESPSHMLAIDPLDAIAVAFHPGFSNLKTGFVVIYEEHGRGKRTTITLPRGKVVTAMTIWNMHHDDLDEDDMVIKTMEKIVLVLAVHDIPGSETVISSSILLVELWRDEATPSCIKHHCIWRDDVQDYVSSLSTIRLEGSLTTKESLAMTFGQSQRLAIFAFAVDNAESFEEHGSHRADSLRIYELSSLQAGKGDILQPSLRAPLDVLLRPGCGGALLYRCFEDQLPGHRLCRPVASTATRKKFSAIANLEYYKDRILEEDLGITSLLTGDRDGSVCLWEPYTALIEHIVDEDLYSGFGTTRRSYVVALKTRVGSEVVAIHEAAEQLGDGEDETEIISPHLLATEDGQCFLVSHMDEEEPLSFEYLYALQGIMQEDFRSAEEPPDAVLVIMDWFRPRSAFDPQEYPGHNPGPVLDADILHSFFKLPYSRQKFCVEQLGKLLQAGSVLGPQDKPPTMIAVVGLMRKLNIDECAQACLE